MPQPLNTEEDKIKEEDKLIELIPEDNLVQPIDTKTIQKYPYKLLIKSSLEKLLLPIATIGFAVVMIIQPTLSDRALTTNSSSPVAASSSSEQKNLPKQLKFNLSVSSPSDLKVKQGDTIESGQVIAERVEEQSRLQAERNSLNLQYQQLLSRTVPKPPALASVPTVQKLPPISYAEEEAAIRAAETNLRLAERAFQLMQQSLKSAPLKESNAVDRAQIEVENRQRLVSNQKRKIDEVEALHELPKSVLDHEQEVLKTKEADLKKATADLNQATAELETASRSSIERLQQLGASVEKARADFQVAIAKLQTKKDQRAYQEYEASITAARRAEEQNQAQENYSRNLLEAEQQERDRQFQISQIRAKLNGANSELTALSVITSPYNGTIKAIRFQRQTNDRLDVELTLVINNQLGDRPNPSLTTRETKQSSSPFNKSPFTSS